MHRSRVGPVLPAMVCGALLVTAPPVEALSPPPDSLQLKHASSCFGLRFAGQTGGRNCSGARQLAAPVDHHALVDADTFPWSAVGKLFNSIGGACTAAAIAPDKVLTAAHCLYAFRTHRFLQPESIHVLLGYARGDYRIHARVAELAIGPGYDPADETRTAASDWAVLTLAEPLPPSVRPVALAQGVPATGTAIAIGGFAQDRAYLMTADAHCRLLGPSADSPVLAHDCVITHGDSGAPLLSAAGSSSVQAFAVTVGFWTVAGRQVGIAAPVTQSLLSTAVAAPASARR